METVRSCLGWQDFNRQTKAGMDIDNIRKSVRKKIANDYLTVTLHEKTEGKQLKKQNKFDIIYLIIGVAPDNFRQTHCLRIWRNWQTRWI